MAAQSLILHENKEFLKEFQNLLRSNKDFTDTIIQCCSEQFVLPNLYHALKNNNLLPLLPPEYQAHLAEIYASNYARNQKILLQIDELCEILHKHNIQPVFLKGTAHLLDGLYKDIGERMIGDIDFLVKEKDYLTTIKILINEGYENQFKLYTDVKDLKHYPRLFRNDVPVDVEIHRVPVNIDFSKQFTTSTIFENARPIPNKINCYVQSDAHKTIHNFIHCQLSNKGYRNKTCPLRDAYDLHLLMQRVDTSMLIEEIEEGEKANNYFWYTKFLFSTPTTSLSKENISTKRYHDKVNFFLNHSSIHRWFIILNKLFHLIFVRYLLLFFKAIFEKKSRDYILRRLKSKEWYSLHFRSFKKYFK